ncbi:MAG: PAS domain S-box protein [Chloroflexota bacterium]|nr:PAS domain S-box protein [Chloroflexota bacterium]
MNGKRGKPGSASVERTNTERESTEEKLYWLERAAEQSIDGIAVANLDGIIQFVNPAWAQMHGYSVDEMMGKHLNTFHTEEQLQKEVIPFNEQVKRTGNHRGEVGHVRKDGATFPTWMTTTLLRDREGNPVGLVAVAHNITGRQQAKKELRESEERYRRLAETMNDGLGIQDENGVFTWVNDKLCKMFGYSREEVIWRPVTDFLDEDSQRVLKEQMPSRRKGKSGSYEMVCIGKDDRKIPIIVAASPIFDADGHFEGSVGVLTDITEQKRMEEELRRHRDRLDELVQERTAELTAANERLQQEIAERQRVEEALRESEERYHGIFNAALDGIVILHSNGVVLDVNPAYCQMLGYSYEDLIGMQTEEVIHPDDRHRLQDEFVHQIREIGRVRLDAVDIHKDGTLVPVEIHGTTFNHSGQRALLAIVRDITERKRTEVALRESNRRLQAIVEDTSRVIYLKDIAGRYLLINRQYEIAINISREQVIGKTDYDIFPRQVADEFRQSDLEAIHTREPVELEETISLAGGEHVYLTVKYCIKNEHGEPYALCGIATDITERKQAEEALRESEEKYRHLVERANDGIVIAQDTLLKYANRRFVETVGYKVEDVIDTPFVNYVWPDERTQVFSRYEQRLAGEDVPLRYETVLQHRDGSKIEVEVNAGIITYQGWPADFVFIQDITERKRAEEELARYREQLEELVKERTRELQDAQEKLVAAERLAVLGRFSGSVSHELRNPLGVIDSSVYYLKMKLEEPDPKVAQHLDRIQTHVQRATAIIESLRNLTQIHTPRKVRIDLASVIDRAVSTSQVPGSVELVRETPQEKWYVDADREQLHMAFENIIRNAVEAMEGQGKLTILARAVSPAGRPFAQISFADTGPGIEPDHLDKIFQPLFSTKVTGLGFGLAICQQIIERHGGTVEAQSEPGQGATFVVRLPLLPTT